MSRTLKWTGFAALIVAVVFILLQSGLVRSLVDRKTCIERVVGTFPAPDKLKWLLIKHKYCDYVSGAYSTDLIASIFDGRTGDEFLDISNTGDDDASWPTFSWTDNVTILVQINFMNKIVLSKHEALDTNIKYILNNKFEEKHFLSKLNESLSETRRQHGNKTQDIDLSLLRYEVDALTEYRELKNWAKANVD